MKMIVPTGIAVKHALSMHFFVVFEEMPAFEKPFRRNVFTTRLVELDCLHGRSWQLPAFESLCVTLNSMVFACFAGALSTGFLELHFLHISK